MSTLIDTLITMMILLSNFIDYLRSTDSILDDHTFGLTNEMKQNSSIASHVAYVV